MVTGGTARPATSDTQALDAGLSHEALHRAPGHDNTLVVEFVPYLELAVDAVGTLVHATDLGEQIHVTHGTRRGWSCASGPIR